MTIFGPMLEHNAMALTNNKELKQTPFQIFGFDVIIDEQLNAHALEVNSSPSLNIYMEKEEYDTKGLVKVDYGEEHVCPVDLHVKSKILVDLMNLTRLPAC